MARPRGFQIEEAEDALLGVFWSKGFEGSSVAELSTATGQKPPSLYAAFGDKDRMFQAALIRYLMWLAGELTPPADGRDGVRHILEATCRLTIGDQARRGCPAVNSVAAREGLTDATNAIVHESFTQLRELLGRQIEASFPGNPPDGADNMLGLLVGATVSIRLLGRAGAADAELHAIAEGAIEAFTRWSE